MYFYDESLLPNVISYILEAMVPTHHYVLTLPIERLVSASAKFWHHLAVTFLFLTLCYLTTTFCNYNVIP